MADNHYYSQDEYYQMIRFYFLCQESEYHASRYYALNFPNQRHPTPLTIAAAHRRFRETGTPVPKFVEGRPRTVMTADRELEVLARFAAAPQTSTRIVARLMHITASQIYKVLKEEKIYPYRFTKTQKLEPGDYVKRMNFCDWLVETVDNDATFLRRIVWSDECTFTREGCFNQHNCHYYSDENPHLARNNNFQYKFKLNVWGAVVDDELIGPIFLPNKMNGGHYLAFLREQLQNLIMPPDRLDDLPYFRRFPIYMQDGAPPHYTNEVRAHLTARFGNHWIGRGAPLWEWPPRSPDLTPCDFGVWGIIKNDVYKTEVNTVEELRARIVDSFDKLRNRRDMIQRMTQSVYDRALICYANEGDVFENFKN